jgi:hypothetical protein
MPKKRHFRITSIARAKANAKEALAVRKAMNRIQRLCDQALAAKTHVDFQSTVAKIRVAVRGLSTR